MGNGRMERKRIVLAESDNNTRQELQRILVEDNLDVIPAVSGPEALEILSRELDTLDLIIIDLDMPGTDTFRIIREIRKMKEATLLPILALSESLDESHVGGTLKNLYVVGFLKKSTPIEEFIFLVRTVLFPKEKLSRKHPRIVVNMPINFQIDNTRFYGHSFTLSEDGIFIRTEYVPMLNTPVRVSFTLPGSSRKIECGSLVVWLNAYAPGKTESIPFGMGLRFTDIRDEDRSTITEFVLNKIVK
jgi:uncharacterized protein (TIGR02266 family)